MKIKRIAKKTAAVSLCSSLILGMLIMPEASVAANAAEEISENTNIDYDVSQGETEEAASTEETTGETTETSPDETTDTDSTVNEVQTDAVDEISVNASDADTEEDVLQTEESADSKDLEGTYDVKKAFEVLSLINKNRQSAGKKRISMDLNLYKAAQVRSSELLEQFSHIRPDGRGCFTAFPGVQISMGENIAQGYSSASSVMSAWMADSAHKATILNDDYASVGIACYYVPGSKYLYYWVQCFGDRVDVNIYQDGDGYTISGPTVYGGVDYSAVYDYSYYIKKYPWIEKRYGNDPDKVLAHFVRHGMKEGRQASASFNVKYYKNRYVDLRTAFGNDLPAYYMHYINNGKKEGRNGKTKCDLIGYITVYGKVDYKDVYDYNYYVAHNETVAEKYKDDDLGALEYFVKTGMAKGDQASASFDVNSYANYYSALRKKYKNNLKKYYYDYISEGKAKNRVATGIKTMRNGVTVYNGTDYSAVFDVGYYANRYSALKIRYGFDDERYIAHFVREGMKEGRRGNKEFYVYKYRSRYSYLRKKYGDDLKKYYYHYMTTGRAEGRIGN